MQWGRLEYGALARVVTTIKRAHALSLLRRRSVYGDLERTRPGIEESDEEQVERNLATRFVLNFFDWRGVKLGATGQRPARQERLWKNPAAAGSRGYDPRAIPTGVAISSPRTGPTTPPHGSDLR
jgi:hypothetical protein